MWATATAEELKALTDQIGIGIFVVDIVGKRQFRFLTINRRVEELTGLRHEAASGLRLEQILPAGLAENAAARYQRCVDDKQPIDYDDRLELPKGLLWCRTVLTPIADADGRIVRILGSAVDMTSRYRAEAELRKRTEELKQSEQRLQLALKGGELGIWEWDIPAQRMALADDWAPTLDLVDGFTSMTGREWISSVHPDDRPMALNARNKVLSGETSNYTIENRFRTRNGDWLWLHVHGTVVERDAAGLPVRVCGTHRDITRQKQDQEALRKLTAELEYRAVHDSLTGVLNRGAILDALDREMTRASRDGTSVTVALLDVDHFKSINDTHGHQAGDQVLQILVERVRAVLRPYDQLGRYGGEEFLIIAPSKQEVGSLHARICEVIAQQPFPTAAGLLPVTASIGVSVYGGGSTTRRAVLAAADQALYRAKEMGRNRVVTAASEHGA